jgi:hypothetical protein
MMVETDIDIDVEKMKDNGNGDGEGAKKNCCSCNWYNGNVDAIGLSWLGK